MLIRQSGDILPSEITPPEIYRERRRFMQGMGVLAAGAAPPPGAGVAAAAGEPPAAATGVPHDPQKLAPSANVAPHFAQCHSLTDRSPRGPVVSPHDEHV